MALAAVAAWPQHGNRNRGGSDHGRNGCVLTHGDRKPALPERVFAVGVAAPTATAAMVVTVAGCTAVAVSIIKVATDNNEARDVAYTLTTTMTAPATRATVVIAPARS